MVAAYLTRSSRFETPQMEPTFGVQEVQNNAGGFVFPLDPWQQLDRWLILGSEGGTYYATERKLTYENTKNLHERVEEDGIRVVQRVMEISFDGRAPKNDMALFALAACAGAKDAKVRRAALQALPKVARIPTHLFDFMTYVKQFRGSGRGLRRAIGEWYENNPNLAYHLVKYQGRNGWTNRDLLRLARPKPTEKTASAFEWAVKGSLIPSFYKDELGLRPIIGFEKIKQANSAMEAALLILKYQLPREAVPTQYQNSPEVWAALLENMPMTALIRNLGNMSKAGIFAPFSPTIAQVVRQLKDSDRLQKARVHPITILSALRTYTSGHGRLGKGTWEVCQPIADALEEAFYMSFKYVEPSGKRIMLGIDVSGSMGGGEVIGSPGLTPRNAAAVLAMVMVRTEPQTYTTIFSGEVAPFTGQFLGRMQSRNKIEPFPISPTEKLNSLVERTSNLPFGSTDCALPMLYAAQRAIEVDAFVILTDNETWSGNIKPFQALQGYRRTFVKDAKLVVVGMTSTGFSIADPNDAGMLDVVGLDSAGPQIISQFIKGDI